MNAKILLDDELPLEFEIEDIYVTAAEFGWKLTKDGEFVREYGTLKEAFDNAAKLLGHR